MFIEKELFEKEDFNDYSRLIHNVFLPESSISSSHSIVSPFSRFNNCVIAIGTVVTMEFLFLKSFVFAFKFIPPFLLLSLFIIYALTYINIIVST